MLRAPQGPAAPHTRHRTDAGKRPDCPNPGLLSGSIELQVPAPSSSGGAHHSAIRLGGGAEMPKRGSKTSLCHFARRRSGRQCGQGNAHGQVMSHISNIVGRLGTFIPNGSVSIMVGECHCSNSAGELHVCFITTQ
ncbi:hypothetical protein CcaCcLH18_00350 [Colletotrichum camelliae]|nr:hypothetical protein CcaCcLH18_00350 [Colletotrichum camelliae]